MVTPFLSGKKRQIKKEEEFHYQFAAQMGSLSQRIYKTCGVTVDELRQLEGIYLICMGKEEIISTISHEQKQLLERVQVNPEMC